MAVVVASKLSKSFGPLVAVNNLDLAIEEGEIFGLLGPNGSGKTTFMRMIVGLVKPSGGTITVLGEPASAKAHLAQIGYMTQAGALYGDLTVRENVEFFAALCGGANRQRIDEVLSLAELSDRAKSPVSTLSGGLKQRVSLACALVHRPRLLILDEPTVGVDPTLRAHLSGATSASSPPRASPSSSPATPWTKQFVATAWPSCAWDASWPWAHRRRSPKAQAPATWKQLSLPTRRAATRPAMLPR